ncbi:MAG: hypothetical protein WB974_21045, partial [Acidobacteriaceae bacterium]
MEEKQAREVARRIAQGHAFDKHVAEGDDFPEVKSRKGFEDLIGTVITDPASHEKMLEDGRQAFWNEPLVILDWWSEDGGTALRPR